MGVALLPYDQIWFPDPAQALTYPNGLLAVGGDLSLSRLLAAYSQGIFPWYNDDEEPILWWSPDPRALFWPDRIHISRSLARRWRKADFEIRFDTAFAQVLAGCAEPDKQRPGTWLTPAMQEAYLALHQAGVAHSVETWREGALIGGLYGVSLGRMFFGESMFTRQADASKLALLGLVQRLQDWSFTLIDCQVLNPHTASLGAVEIPRAEFLALVARNNAYPSRLGPWCASNVPLGFPPELVPVMGPVLDSRPVRNQDQPHD